MMEKRKCGGRVFIPFALIFSEQNIVLVFEDEQVHFDHKLLSGEEFEQKLSKQK